MIPIHLLSAQILAKCLWSQEIIIALNNEEKNLVKSLFSFQFVEIICNPHSMNHP